MEVVAGHDVSLYCHAHGIPRPTVTWYHNGTPLYDTPGYVELNHNNTLTLERVHEDQMGDYECHADNGVGDAQKRTVHLHVIGKILLKFLNFFQLLHKYSIRELLYISQLLQHRWKFT